MPLFKFLHIACMFAAVSLSLGPSFLLRRVANAGDVRAIRTAFKLNQPLGMAHGILFVFGAIFGVITALLGGFNFAAPWLLIAYALFTIIFFLGAGVSAPWQQKVEQAAASSEDTPSPELQEALQERTALYADWAAVLLVITIIFDMVIKPFS